MNLPDASKVSRPAETLIGEIKALDQVIRDIDGKMLEMVVQRDRLNVMRNCMTIGFRSLFPGEDTTGQLDLPLGSEN
jgi:hypothetical protein